MSCPQCGVEVVAGSTFCHKCGARVEVKVDPAVADMTGRLIPPEGHSRILSAAPRVEDEDREASEPNPDPGPRRAFMGGGSGKDEERDIWVARYSAKSMIGTWIAAMVLSIGAIVLAAMYGGIWYLLGFLVVLWGGIQLRLWYLQLNNRYRLTSQRLINEAGIISRTVNRIELLDINDLQMKRGLIERLVGTGTIIMITGDVTDSNFRIPGLDNIEERFEQLEKALRTEKRRREIKIEAG